MTSSRLSAIALAVLVACLAALADEGRAPIHETTVITQPGHYVLTRDLSAGPGPILTVNASGVVVDLGGRTITNLSNGPTIEIDGSATDVTVRNGRISGGGNGIQHVGFVAAALRFEDLEIRDNSGDGLRLESLGAVEVRRCRFIEVSGSGIHVTGDNGRFTGQIVDNTVIDPQWNGIDLDGMRGGIVRGNEIVGHGAALASAAGIQMIAGPFTAGGNIVTGNTVRDGGSDDAGIVVSGTSEGNLIAGNVASGNGGVGIEVSSNANRIVGNLASENLDSGIKVHTLVGVSYNVIAGNEAQGNTDAGIEVWGSYNLVEDNLAEDNLTYGLKFSMYHDSAYRGNMLRGNGVGAVGGSGSATDEGGNIL